MNLLFMVNDILILILILYGDASLPMNIVQTVINFFDSFFKNIFVPSIEKDIFEILNSEENIIISVDRIFT